MAAPPRPALTRALIARRFPDPVPDAGRIGPYLDEAEIAARLDADIAAAGGPDRDIWLFGYGSLVWQPRFEVAERRTATAHGWHRRFCLWQWWSRGTREAPNLMLALDRGGSCTGIAYRVPGPDVKSKVAELWRRELMGDGYRTRWLNLSSPEGPLRAVAFVANHETERYAGKLSDHAVADRLAAACGHFGSGAEYLLNTVAALERIGVRDGRLWRLQEMVAERIAANCEA